MYKFEFQYLRTYSGHFRHMNMTHAQINTILDTNCIKLLRVYIVERNYLGACVVLTNTLRIRYMHTIVYIFETIYRCLLNSKNQLFALIIIYTR